MRNLIFVAVTAALSVGALAQDKITLTNGDVITGKITTMADGKVTIKSPLLDEMVIPMEKIGDMVTQDQVTLETKSGDLWQRRIIGIEGGSLRLEGGETTALAIDNLGMINPPESPPPAWTGSLRFTGLYTDGNTSRKSAGLLFDAVRRTEADRITVDALWDYGEDKDVDPTSATFRQRTLTQRRAGAGLQYDLFMTKRSYLLATARAFGDTLADLKLRFTSGLGYGYTLIDDSTTTLLTEVGLSYFSESYRTTGVPTQDGLTARVAYRLEHKFTEDTRLLHRVEAYPSLEVASDIYLQSLTEVSTSLTESMVASVAHTLNFDNTPSPGRQRADNRFLLTIGWTF